jgi:hypothetical protein
VVALAFAAAMATGALLVLALWPRPVTGTALGDGYALAATGAAYSVEGRQVSLHRGRLAVSAWGAPLRVEAGGQRVEVESAVAVFEVAGEQVRVLPVDGVVLLQARGCGRRRRAARPRVTWGRSWPRARRGAPRPRRGGGVGGGGGRRLEEAVTAYGLVAASTSLRAEVALLKARRARAAAAVGPGPGAGHLRRGGRPVPAGALALERSLSALEAAAALADWGDVDRRAEAFEASFPASERLDEVRRARALALYALHQVDAACVVARSLRQPTPFSSECAGDATLTPTRHPPSMTHSPPEETMTQQPHGHPVRHLRPCLGAPGRRLLVRQPGRLALRARRVRRGRARSHYRGDGPGQHGARRHRARDPAGASRPTPASPSRWAWTTWSSADVAGPVAIWGPAGTRFSKKARMTLPLTVSAEAGALTVQVREADGREFELPASAVLVADGRISFDVEGFTSFQPRRRSRPRVRPTCACVRTARR